MIRILQPIQVGAITEGGAYTMVDLKPGQTCAITWTGRDNWTVSCNVDGKTYTSIYLDEMAVEMGQVEIMKPPAARVSKGGARRRRTRRRQSRKTRK